MNTTALLRSDYFPTESNSSKTATDFSWEQSVLSWPTSKATLPVSNFQCYQLLHLCHKSQYI